MDIKKLLLLIVLVPLVSSAKSDEFPKDDYKTLFKDLNEALGLEQIFDSIGLYFRTYVRIGQSYTSDKFNRDMKDLKNELTLAKVSRLIHKMFWVGISQTGVRLINSAHHGQIFLLRFLKGKCDKHLGKDCE